MSVIGSNTGFTGKDAGAEPCSPRDGIHGVICRTLTPTALFSMSPFVWLTVCLKRWWQGWSLS